MKGEFTCCKCYKTKPYIEAHSRWNDMEDIKKYWCDDCEVKRIKSQDGERGR